MIQEAKKLVRTHPDTKIDYISIYPTDTLVDMAVVDRPALMALAVR
ncbi:MAG: hypothetical protein R2874_13020 [Desulfobacterales bacterium]